MSNPTPLARTSQVVFSNLAAADLRIALDLLAGEAAGESDATWTRIVGSHEPHEVFASLLYLLLTQARTAGETLAAPGRSGTIGASRYLTLMATLEETAPASLLLHQVSMTLRQDPDTDRLCLSQTSVFTLARVCSNIAADLARRDGTTLLEHLTSLSTLIDGLYTRSTA